MHYGSLVYFIISRLSVEIICRYDYFYVDSRHTLYVLKVFARIEGY